MVDGHPVRHFVQIRLGGTDNGLRARRDGLRLGAGLRHRGWLAGTNIFGAHYRPRVGAILGSRRRERHRRATKVCWGDGSTLAHIPDASVDHVTSNAAVHHLRGATQCSLVLDYLLRILRPGGTLWIGWQLVEDKNDLHGATPFQKEDWR